MTRHLDPDPDKWTIGDLELMTEEQKELFYQLLDKAEDAAFSNGPVIAASRTHKSAGKTASEPEDRVGEN